MEVESTNELGATDQHVLPCNKEEGAIDSVSKKADASIPPAPEELASSEPHLQNGHSEKECVDSNNTNSAAADATEQGDSFELNRKDEGNNDAAIANVFTPVIATNQQASPPSMEDTDPAPDIEVEHREDSNLQQPHQEQHESKSDSTADLHSDSHPEEIVETTNPSIKSISYTESNVEPSDQHPDKDLEHSGLSENSIEKKDKRDTTEVVNQDEQVIDPLQQAAVYNVLQEQNQELDPPPSVETNDNSFSGQAENPAATTTRKNADLKPENKDNRNGTEEEEHLTTIEIEICDNTASSQADAGDLIEERQTDTRQALEQSPPSNTTDPSKRGNSRGFFSNMFSCLKIND